MKRLFLIIPLLITLVILFLLVRKDVDTIKYPDNTFYNETYDYKKEKDMEVEPALDLWKFKLSKEYQALTKTKTIKAQFNGKVNINDITIKDVIIPFLDKVDIEFQQINVQTNGFFDFDFENLLLIGNVKLENINIKTSLIKKDKRHSFEIKGDIKFDIYVKNNYIYLDFENTKLIITKLETKKVNNVEVNANDNNNSNDKNTLDNIQNNIVIEFGGKYKIKSEAIGDLIKLIRDYYINYLNVAGSLIETIKEILKLKIYNGYIVYNFTQKMIKDSINDDLIYNYIKTLFDEKYEFKLLLNLHHRKAKVFIVDKTKDKDYTDNIEFYIEGFLGENNNPNEVIIDIDENLLEEVSDIKNIIKLPK